MAELFEKCMLGITPSSLPVSVMYTNSQNVMFYYNKREHDTSDINGLLYLLREEA